MNGSDDILQQLRDAILCSFDLVAISTVEAKNTINEAKHFIDHIELLKDQQGELEGWKYFLHLFTVEIKRPEVPFLCLQRLTNQIRNISIENRKLIHSALLEWLSQNCSVPTATTTNSNTSANFIVVLSPKYIRTKLSVLIAKLIQLDYPQLCPNAFENIAILLEKGNTGVDIYLRILIALDQEIFENNTQYWAGKTKEELLQNTNVKDTLRKSSSMQNIVNVWYQIITLCSSHENNAEANNLVDLCLETIKCWARWVDIKYLIDQRFLQFFYNVMEHSARYRDDVCDCLHEVIARGMPPGQKINLIEGMSVIKLLNNHIGIHYNNSSNNNHDSKYNATEDDDVLKFSIVGRLVDTCCFELLKAREKLCEFLINLKMCNNNNNNNHDTVLIHHNGEDINAVIRDLKRCENSLMELLNLYWAYLSHPRFEVSNPLVEDSLRLYLKIMQKEKNSYYLKMNQQHLQELKFHTENYTNKLLNGLLQSIHYPVDYDFDGTSYDEDNEFINHHMAVSKCLVMVARCIPDKMQAFIIHSMQHNIFESIARFQENNGDVNNNGAMAANAISFSVIEANLQMLYSFAEGANNTKILRTPDMIQFITIIHTCGINLHQHHHVLVRYFDITFRFAKPLLQTNLAILKSVLKTLLSNQGIRNPKSIVRSRACYYLKRISKILQKPVANFFNDILNSIYPLLKIPLPSISGNNSSSSLSKDNVYLLYDVCGMLMTHLSNNVEIIEFAKILFGPLHNAMIRGMQGLIEDLQAQGLPQLNDLDAAGDYFADVIQAAGTTTKTFPSTLPDDVRLMLRQSLEAAMKVFLDFPDHKNIRSKIIFFFHRMIAVLRDGFVEYLPPILGPIIKDIKAENAIETIQLINQLLSKYKGKMGPIMPEIMMPIFTKLTSSMPNVEPRKSGKIPPTDDQQSRESLQRGFVLFLQNILVNDLENLLSHPSIAPNLMNILHATLQSAVDVPNPSTGKSVFAIISLILKAFIPEQQVQQQQNGSSNGIHSNVGKIKNNIAINKSDQLALVNFCLTQAVPISIKSAIFVGFEEHDCAGTFAFAKEIALFYNILLQRCGNQLVNYLREFCFKIVNNCPQMIVDNLVTEILNGNIKKVRKWLLQLVKFTQQKS
jgi:hypothetical protein